LATGGAIRENGNFGGSARKEGTSKNRPKDTCSHKATYERDNGTKRANLKGSARQDGAGEQGKETDGPRAKGLERNTTQSRGEKAPKEKRSTGPRDPYKKDLRGKGPSHKGG